MSQTNLAKRIGEPLRNSVTFKLVVVCVLILLLLVPAGMIQSLINERQFRKSEAVADISAKWGATQTVSGPVLSVPFRRYYVENKERRFNIEFAHFLPQTLKVDGELLPEIRYRGIYKAVLYRAKLNIAGEFARPDFNALSIGDADVIWDRALITLGVSDMKGIRETVAARIDDAPLTMNPGIETQDVLGSGVSARVPAARKGAGFKFAFTLDINGSDAVQFVPVGESTSVHIASQWPSPSFDGAFLPVAREVGESGFNADWKVLHLNRNFPQAWIGKQKIEESAFGVRLFIAADVYQQATRTAKYALLFILLTFTTFFFTEIVNRKRLHPIQYLLIGFALMIFYTLLIALSEHISFGISYLGAAFAVVALITSYAHWSLANSRLTLLVGGVLVLLYGYLYIILQLEDYALLMGSIGLFATLAIVMYATRRIDWYGVSLGTEK